MTRNHFLTHVAGSWDTLLDFCNSVGCPACEGIYDESVRDESIVNYIRDAINRHDRWQEIRNWLDNLDDEFEYYRLDYGAWEGMNEGSDLDDYVRDVLAWCDENDIWDDPEEEEEDPEEIEEDDDDIVAEEDFSIGELFNACNDQLQQIGEAERERTAPAPYTVRYTVQDDWVTVG